MKEFEKVSKLPGMLWLMADLAWIPRLAKQSFSSMVGKTAGSRFRSLKERAKTFIALVQPSL